MRIFTKIFLSLSVLTALVLALFADQITKTFKSEFRKATEEPLVDLSRTLAGIVTLSLKGGELDRESLANIEAMMSYLKNHPLEAKIYDFKKAASDYEVYVTDSKGIVIYHSGDPSAVGEDFSQWNDINASLRGNSGARTTREKKDPDTSVLYISTPIMVDSRIVGVLSIGKSAHTTNQLVSGAKKNVWVVAFGILGGLFLVSYLISRNLVRPIEALTRYAHSVALGQKVLIPSCDTLELKTMGSAFQKMKIALEGKEYVERYVQTLAHELKTPLFAIKGAIEILTPSVIGTSNEKFLTNIERETNRLELIIQDLMLLASLERERIDVKKEEIDLDDFLNERIAFLSQIASARSLVIKLNSEVKTTIFTDRKLLAYAFDNLLKNALDFANNNSIVNVIVSKNSHLLQISISNFGPRIPDYALQRIFERFYSLPRGRDGHKSSGLGLCIAKEACDIMGGKLRVNNIEDGVQASITL